MSAPPSPPETITKSPNARTPGLDRAVCIGGYSTFHSLPVHVTRSFVGMRRV